MGSPEEQSCPNTNIQHHSNGNCTDKLNADSNQNEGGQPSEMNSGVPNETHSIESELNTPIAHEGLVEPVRLHIKLNSHKKKKDKKRSKYVCRKCNIPRFGGRLLFRQHLLSHINSTTARVSLNRLRLPNKVVLRASKYYARKYPTGVFAPTELCTVNDATIVTPHIIGTTAIVSPTILETTAIVSPTILETTAVVTQKTHETITANTGIYSGAVNSFKPYPSVNTCVLKRISEYGAASYAVENTSLIEKRKKSKIRQNHKTLNGMISSSIVKPATMSGTNESSTDDSRGKELMEELGIQMNKLAGSFFRNDMQNAAASFAMKQSNANDVPQTQQVEQSLPPPLVADNRPTDTQTNFSSLQNQSSSSTQNVNQQGRNTPQTCNPISPSANQHQQGAASHTSGQSSQLGMQISRVSSPTVAPRLSPHPLAMPNPTQTAASHPPSPQAFGPTIANTSPRMSPHMTPPLMQRSGLSPHLPPHMQGLGNAMHRSPQSSTPPSPVASQPFATPTLTLPTSRPSVVMTSGIDSNERCESVMIIEKPQSSSEIVNPNTGPRIHQPQPMTHLAVSMASSSNSQGTLSTSAETRNPLALLRQLDPVKSMPKNISMQASHAVEDQSRPASVMILENPRDNPTPKFNIGNVVSLAPGYFHQQYGNSAAASFAPNAPSMPHLLQDISSNCSCNTCTDIRSGDLIRRAQIMIQAGHYEYKCPMCIRRFAHKSSLLRHTRSFNHGYVCDLCSSGFLGQVAFECHKRLHQEKSFVMPNTGNHGQTSSENQQINQHPGSQVMHPPPPPLLSSMNRRLIMGNGGASRDINVNNMAMMSQQKQVAQRRPENNSMVQINTNNRNVVDDDVVVLGIERRQQVPRQMGRALPPPPPLERAPRPNLQAANNNRIQQDRLNMSSVSGLMVASSMMSRNVNVQQRGGDTTSKTISTPLAPQSQLARIFNNSEITLTPIGNEGAARKLGGITITPTSLSGSRHPPAGNSNMNTMNNVGQMRPRGQLMSATNNNYQRYPSPVISNVRHIGPSQGSIPRAASMGNMNQTFAPNSRQQFVPQMQNTRMPMRGVAPATAARTNQLSNILNSDYISQLTAMRQSANVMNNNNSSNRPILNSRSETGTHTSYRMMPVANPSLVQHQQSGRQHQPGQVHPSAQQQHQSRQQLQSGQQYQSGQQHQSGQQPTRTTLPTWHHPVSAEAYGANAMSKNNARSNTMTSTSASNNSTTQANGRPLNSVQSSSSVLPSNSNSSGPNRFPITINQTQAPSSGVTSVHGPQMPASQPMGTGPSGTGHLTVTNFVHKQVTQDSRNTGSTNISQKDMISCPFCSMKFCTTLEFQNHYRQVHNKSAANVKCSKCQAQFLDPLSLKGHEATCQEKIPCIRCNMMILQEKWASHCAEFHTSETQNDVASITLTNPFENNGEMHSPSTFENQKNSGTSLENNNTNVDIVTNVTAPSFDAGHSDQQTSIHGEQDHSMSSSEINFQKDKCRSTDNENPNCGLSDQDINTDIPTDDDVLVHDLSVAAASEIQLINDTVKDIADNGGTKMASSEANQCANDLPINEEDKPANTLHCDFSSSCNKESENFENVPNNKSFELASTGNEVSDSVQQASAPKSHSLDANEELNLQEDDLSKVGNSEPTATENDSTRTTDNFSETNSSNLPQVTEESLISDSISSGKDLERNMDDLEKNKDNIESDYISHSETADKETEGVDCIQQPCPGSEDDDHSNIGLVNAESEGQLRLSLDLEEDGDELNGDQSMNTESDENVATNDYLLSNNEFVTEDLEHSKDIHENENLIREGNDENIPNAEELGEVLSDETEKSFLCPICDQLFSTKKEFLKHILIHQSPKLQTCHLCNSTYSTRKKLVLHLRSHMKSCSKVRRLNFGSPALTAKRPRHDSGNSGVDVGDASTRSKLMVALLDMDKVAANVGFLQRMGVVGLISLNDLQLHIGAGNLPNDISDPADLNTIPIVNFPTD